MVALIFIFALCAEKRNFKQRTIEMLNLNAFSQNYVHLISKYFMKNCKNFI